MVPPVRIELTLSVFQTATMTTPVPAVNFLLYLCIFHHASVSWFAWDLRIVRLRFEPSAYILVPGVGYAPTTNALSRRYLTIRSTRQN